MSGPSMQEKLLAIGRRLKAIVSKDYSVSEFKEILSNALTYAKDLRGKRLQESSTGSAHNPQLNLKSVLSVSPSIAMQFAQRCVTQYRNFLIVILLFVMIFLLHRFVLAPLVQQVESKLVMRPAQWSQLQNLVKLSKSGISSSSSMISTVAPLDDMELQKLRSVLTARGLKPAVLRLTTDNPPRVELQASDVMFSVLLDTVDELRTSWRLYPSQLNVVAAGGPGLVNVSGSFAQMHSQQRLSSSLGMGQ